jgi:hypothetical protein
MKWQHSALMCQHHSLSDNTLQSSTGGKSLIMNSAARDTLLAVTTGLDDHINTLLLLLSFFICLCQPPCFVNDLLLFDLNHQTGGLQKVEHLRTHPGAPQLQQMSTTASNAAAHRRC